MVLIVCEGEKTEPNYFRAMIADLQLNTANIVIAKNTGGSSPRTIVDFALEEYKKEKEYDRVYCVFDKDRHTTYDDALDRIMRSQPGKGHSILAITSIPCFEFWILLHFEYTTKQFDIGTGSICANVIADLKAYMPRYSKGDEDIYQATKDQLETAITNSKKVVRHCETGGTDMPSTKVHELVEYLKNLKAQF
ncbi:MAG: RloB family protein [Desulfoprunum sp.]|nr:RloB family protein [Desulfoprunum sp.]